MQIDPTRVLMFMFSIVIAIALHEFGHALAADRLGDDTPRRENRLTIDPSRHFDFTAIVVLIISSLAGFGLGWGKPVRIDSQNFKNPRIGDMIVSLAGPAMNLLQAIVLGIIIRAGYFHLPPTSPYYALINIALQINVVLFVFNLIPIPPLDGSHVFADILPLPIAKAYQELMTTIGWILLFAVIFFGKILIEPAVAYLERLLAGTLLL